MGLSSRTSLLQFRIDLAAGAVGFVDRLPAAISIAVQAGGVKRLNPGYLLDSTKKAVWAAAAGYLVLLFVQRICPCRHTFIFSRGFNNFLTLQNDVARVIRKSNYYCCHNIVTWPCAL